MATTNQVTKPCEICETVCTKDEYAKVHVCGSTCRSKYYRDREQRKLIDKAIENNNLKKIGISVRNIMNLGYSVTIQKNEELHV